MKKFIKLTQMSNDDKLQINIDRIGAIKEYYQNSIAYLGDNLFFVVKENIETISKLIEEVSKE